MVVLTPDNNTLIIAISWAPTPVYLTFDEKGVIKVHPDKVKIAFEHLLLYFFFHISFICKQCYSSKRIRNTSKWISQKSF